MWVFVSDYVCMLVCVPLCKHVCVCVCVCERETLGLNTSPLYILQGSKSAFPERIFSVKIINPQNGGGQVIES